MTRYFESPSSRVRELSESFAGDDGSFHRRGGRIRSDRLPGAR